MRTAIVPAGKARPATLRTARPRFLPALLLVLFGLLGAAPALGQTGKIVGRVTDAQTGEPLPGVNVVIDGTTQGTATDFDGQYVIIGVRPGTYAVVASFIGFAAQRREDVQINVDLTTTVDFALTEEVIEGEEIVVTAEVVTVRKDLTSSEARVTSETIERLPVTELGQVLEVQAGVTARDGNIHIRGGRSSEVLYMVDGVPVTDSYDGSAAIQLENEGVQELQVISGTFNAEHGNAMSGVINVVSKEGRGDRLAGTVGGFLGSYAVAGSGGSAALRGTRVGDFTVSNIQYRNVDPYSYLPVEPTHFANLKASLEGPILSERLTFFALGRYFKNDGYHGGARLYNLDGTAGDSSIVTMNPFEKVSWQGNLRYRLSNKLILNLIGLGSFEEGRDYNLYWRWAPDGRPRWSDRGYDVKLKLTHLISATTFYTLDVATFFRNEERGLYDDPLDPRYNDFTLTPPDTIEVVPGSGVYVPVLVGSNRYARGGTDLGRLDRTTRSYLAKGDLSSQLGRHHLVKAGFQARLDDLTFRGYGLIPAVDETGQRVEPFRPAIPTETSSSFNGFDDVRPITLSAYIQDKIEFDNFIVNAGIRFDYFDPRSQVPVDPEDPNIYNPFKKINRFRDQDGDGVISEAEEVPGNVLTVADREAYWWTDAGVDYQISPRLGVAYPITEAGVIHFSYGLFFQIPTLNNLFDQYGYKIPGLSGIYGPYGNPDLKSQKTTMYEIGFKQGFGDYVVDVTGFYRDIRNWVSTSVLNETALPGVTYVVFANRDYSNVRGVTVSLSRGFTDNYGFDLNYTFQVVEGSNSNPEDEFTSYQNNNQPTLQLLPLNWDQRHKLAGGAYYGRDTWGGSVRMRFESGFPYTPSFPEGALVGSDVEPEFPTNSRVMASTFELDLNVYKEFPVGRLRPRLFVDVYNVLDTRNVANVFGDTGEPDLTLFQLNTGSFDPGYFVRPEFYREPRRVQVGLEFRF